MTGFFRALLIICCTFAFSMANANNLKHIILAEGPIQVDLQQSMQWVKADHTTFSLAQLLLNQNAVFTGLSDNSIVEANEIYWLRFKVINPTNLTIPVALTLSSSSIQIDAAYRQENQTWRRISGVDHQKQLSSHTALILSVDPKSNQWMYFQIKPIQSSRLEPKLQDLNQYAKDSSLLQQILGAVIALMIFIAFLHIIAIRFHNHIRHYLTVFLALIGVCFGLSHSQLLQWPDWFLTFAKLSPWGMGCTLYLSSFTTEQYRKLLKSTRMVVTILVMLFLTLLLAHVNFLITLIFVLIPSGLVLLKIKKISINLSIANGILAASTLWQIMYILYPSATYAADSITIVYALTLCTLFSSLSMITPYFQRQTIRKQIQNQGVSSLFLENLSHELRTPMNGVLGMSELLTETPLSAKQRDYIETIHYSGFDMLRMINRMSDYAKVQSGRVLLNKSKVELSALAQKCLSKFQFSANQKGLELVLNIDKSLPKHLLADERRIETILDNLLDNAVRHTEFGEIELRVSLLEDNKVVFVVRDTGTGIDRLRLKNLLNQQDEDAVTDKPHGFGLALCKQLIETIDGNLYVESRPDIGSTFSFTLPLDSVESVEIEATPNHQALEGLSILIVDDNGTLRKVMQRYANSWGMQSESTFSGKEALALLRSQSNIGTPFDIIIIDQDMPIMDGFQLAKRIQEDKDIDPSLIKIMLTGMSISNNQKEVLQYGIDQVITKPVSVHELEQVLTKHVQLRHKRSKQA